MACQIRSAFENPKLWIPGAVKDDLTAIFNRRVKAFLDNGPTDIYFTAVYLDPRKYLRVCALSSRTHLTPLLLGYPKSRILKNPGSITTLGNTITIPAGPCAAGGAPETHSVPFPKAFECARKFLKTVMGNEFDLPRNEGLFRDLQDTYKKFRASIAYALHTQLVNFSNNMWPFNTGVLDPTVSPLDWWQSLLKMPQADVLAVHNSLIHLTVSITVFAAPCCQNILCSG